MTVTITAFAILAGTLIYIAYDVIVATNTKPGDTISEVVRRWGLDFPAVPFAWGLLAGHFWMGTDLVVADPWIELVLALVGLAGASLASVLFYLEGRKLTWLSALIALAIGIAWGHVFWSQAA